MYNLYDEDEEEEIPTKEKLEENDKMKEKLVSLRNKMETMTITKKVNSFMLFIVLVG
jgi:hypothetical protein